MTSEPFTHPRLGCGAAIVQAGRILLLRRARPPEVGHWSLPGGKVDLWETVEAAVRREVAEELGIVLGPLQLLCVVDHMADGQHWVAPTYLATTFDGEPENLEPGKHTGLDWFPLDALPSPLAQVVTTAVAALARR